MKRTDHLFICGSADFYRQFLLVFAKMKSVQLRHFFNQPEAFLVDDIPSAWIFESDRLSLLDGERFEKLRYKIQASMSLGLIATRSIEDVIHWRQKPFKPLHLLHGNPSGQQIMERIHSLYEERTLLNLPKVMMLCDDGPEHVLLEKKLKDRGICVRSLHKSEAEILPEILIGEACKYLIWSLSVPVINPEALYGMIKAHDQLKSVKIYLFVDGSLTANEAWRHFPALVRRRAFNETQSEKLLQRLFKDIQADIVKPVSYRDHRCGIMDARHFNAYLQKNMIQKHLSFEFADLMAVELQCGDILAQSLEHELCYFIRNNVRISDVVARGKQGQVLATCHHMDDEHLIKMGNRLINVFKEKILKPLNMDVIDVNFRIISHLDTVDAQPSQSSTAAHSI